MILVSRSSPQSWSISFPKFVIFILAWVYHNGRRKTIAYLKRLHILQWHMQNVQHTLQNVQYHMQNMQYKIKLSPSYPQSYPQKGVMPCKTCSANCKPCSAHCKMCSATCKIRSTTCKIRSTKQSYPQSYPQKGVIPLQNVQYPMQNMQHHMQDTQHHLQNMQYSMQNTQYHLQNIQHPLQNTQYKTKLSPSYPQSYPQWICHRKMDLKNKSKCFILTWVIR